MNSQYVPHQLSAHQKWNVLQDRDVTWHFCLQSPQLLRLIPPACDLGDLEVVQIRACSTSARRSVITWSSYVYFFRCCNTCLKCVSTSSVIQTMFNHFNPSKSSALTQMRTLLSDKVLRGSFGEKNLKNRLKCSCIEKQLCVCMEETSGMCVWVSGGWSDSLLC